MKYKEIVSVTGLSGLYQLISSKSDGAILRSLEDKSTKFVSSRIHNFTPLESIEVFTTGENTNLAAVFKAMKEKETQHKPVDAKADNNQVKVYFKAVFPEFDEERVYVSDMKKMVKWYDILKANDLLQFEEAPDADEDPEEETVAEEKPNEEKRPAEKKTAHAVQQKISLPSAKEISRARPAAVKKRGDK